jgi:superfamily II DNA or RNA helicase
MKSSNRKYISKVQPKTKESITIPKFVLSDDYLKTICSQSYLGKKGYTIPKSILSKEDEEFLKKELFVKPEIFGANYGTQAEPAFPVFRENSNKIYLPRFYGINRYGIPSRSEIGMGDNISVEFTKPLRDYQDKIIDVYTKYVDTPICKGALEKGGGGILEVPCGRGKCLGKNTPIMMYDGTIKMVQDIVVSDVIMGDDSKPRNVLSLARGREMMYKISYHDNEYIVNESHILSLKFPKNELIIDLPLLDYLNICRQRNSNPNNMNTPMLLGYRVPIVFDKKEIEIEPYILGYWLGGHGDLHQDVYGETERLLEFLKKYDLNNKQKHIPHHYKCNSVEIQLQLLAGIIDSVGCLDMDNYTIIQEHKQLSYDILFLCRSLGLCVKQHVVIDVSNIVYYKNIINGDGLEYIPVKYQNKKANLKNKYTDMLKYKIDVKRLAEDEYYGFEIDGNRRFVLGDFTVTHNTVMALKIISILQKKTLIIVHKEFLMNQWIERIQEFLPTANVGKIQGPVFDVDKKDIVIGMIQTLYDKEYSVDTFSCFGLTIIDEVHRIGSEQFSRTLFKTITPYMLGISATVDRKDKLTKILYMFIGDKIYSETREDDDPVCVRAINYRTNNTEFNMVDYDFRGNPKYSTMITKLCEYGPRSDFIVRIIRDLIEENPENQIMVLCHNRSLLTYLYEAVNHRKIASIGYYVGGMKQTNLQETETKQIVLATYAMAAEALDIKTLSSLIMVTPKTDITQSVGRILRVKHENPIIVDIVDGHDIFQNQWNQRKRFYKKCNYRIRQIDSDNYKSMNLDWNTDTTWKRVFEPIKKATECTTTEDSNDSNNNVLNKIVNSRQSKCLLDISKYDFDEMEK